MKKSAAAALAARLGSKPPRFPTVDDMVAKYGGDLGPAVHAEIEHLAFLLDSLWPTWADEDPKKRSMHPEVNAGAAATLELVSRFKQVILRRDLLLDGKPFWGVKLLAGKPGSVVRTADGHPWPLARAIHPPRTAKARALIARGETDVHWGPLVSPRHLAAQLTRDLGRPVTAAEVRKLLSNKPPEAHPVLFVRELLANAAKADT